MPESDEAAFKRVQAGDHTAFAVLADRYQRRAFAVALRLLGNRADAEDAVQHAFLRLYESRAAYRSRWRLNTWFYRILTNTCIDELRRARPTASLDGLDFSATETPDRVLAERERDRLLRAALATIPVEARIVDHVVLRRRTDLSGYRRYPGNLREYGEDSSPEGTSGPSQGVASPGGG